MQSITIGGNQEGQRLDKFLCKYLPEAGSGFLYKMLRKKNITLNGKKAMGKEILSYGDEVKFFLSDETLEKFSGKSPFQEYMLAFQQLKDIGILYEDENIILLNKPAGILTQKAAPTDLSLNEWLIGYLMKNDRQVQEELASFRPSVCNRLDRNTSGIVLCGKSLSGSQTLSRMIRERSLQKYYYTVCFGEIKKPSVVEGYLVKKQGSRTVVVSSADERTDTQKEGDTGGFIKTAYRPLCMRNGYTLLEVELITGKTHQIRAHLASIGHPVIGDFKYGDRKRNEKIKERFGLQYQLLHAHHVVFPDDIYRLREYGHPAGDFSETCNAVTAPCPSQFQTICERLGLCLEEEEL